MSLFSSYKDVFTAVAAIVGLCGFIFAIVQYTIAQKWKRNEFLANEMKEFFCDEKIMETLRFFDYWGASFPAKIDGKDDTVTVYYTESQIPKGAGRPGGEIVCLTHALRSSDDAVYTEAEQLVRDRLDNYLGSIERLCAFIKNGLFSTAEVTPFLKYHIALLNGMKTHSQGYHRQLFGYMLKYDYSLSFELLCKFPQHKVVEDAIRQARINSASVEE